MSGVRGDRTQHNGEARASEESSHTGHTGHQPRRTVVTSPRMRASVRQRQYVTREIDAQTPLGQVYMRSLIRAQLHLGLLVLAVVGAVLLGLPLLFAGVPELGSVSALGLPLPWLLLGVVVHPALIAAAWFYVRQAERNEREFADLVERS
ncbi:MAG TPA: hypothetical protein VE287_00730 [Actinopolymorphaceae bacterium]|nr:hypothetical protein [Actinopolymorphaceae bacterium]